MNQSVSNADTFPRVEFLAIGEHSDSLNSLKNFKTQCPYSNQSERKKYCDWYYKNIRSQPEKQEQDRKRARDYKRRKSITRNGGFHSRLTKCDECGACPADWDNMKIVYVSRRQGKNICSFCRKAIDQETQTRGNSNGYEL